ncbi:PAS domain-containing protein [Rubellimicrobium arenae]|uniref:PAS domain-containing protein n=1 Tax=Rubellimicrobium arenae TaxID=2817372 RepID=UPI001B30F905|nr:PAS domain-containing protein [Rubellimicrobium arenae]
MNASAHRDWINERRLKALLEASGQIHFRMNADWSEMQRLSGGGLLSDATAPLPDWQERYIPSEDREFVRGKVAQAVAEGCPLTLEHRIYRIDGAVTWIRTRAVPLRSPDGAIEEWLGAAEDVSEARAARELLAEREERLALALAAADLSTWDWDMVTGRLNWSEGHYRLLGYAPGEIVPSYEAWATRVHPDDLPDVETRITQARETQTSYEAEFRVLAEAGPVRWCRARARFHYDEAGHPIRMIGVMQDITAAKLAEKQERVLLAELQHRVRNTLSMVRSIVRRSAATATSKDSFATHLDGRVTALGRVQAAITRASGTGVDLETLLRDEMQGAAVSEDRLRLAGPPVRLPNRMVELMALTVHELTTNAIKYGALAAPDGMIAVEWTLEGAGPPRLSLRWSETGRVARRPASRRRGFGTELLERMLPYSLGAQTRVDLRPDGLLCEIELPLA